MTPDTKTYESVGRMFVLTDIPLVCKNLSNRIAVCEEKIKTLEVGNVSKKSERLFMLFMFVYTCSWKMNRCFLSC